MTSTTLMTPKEVATLFSVDPRTVRRWAIAGKVNVVVLPSGHRRFYRDEIESLLARKKTSS